MCVHGLMTLTVFPIEVWEKEKQPVLERLGRLVEKRGQGGSEVWTGEEAIQGWVPVQT